ncbi:hypothetical protein DICPUDRAFT_37701 [Dictyostelium purpureum]|uniref:Uncharacterized protein n=1 Tax=Dictyostelium purpureum TaxID=5786 RepID=F0ZT92_DICPU|nr:uncharacterized protein DICPUDRAFT_37701 [Dictyostelium purpureum]EGC32843.1 hypothetical protein DICPUDRAFT_37701 [Dictyostelium purpureum]|eukprot:XP_003290628.1 hypothetical protein DICPUDRAFT_37701 [Dictyostelium purpureum]
MKFRSLNLIVFLYLLINQCYCIGLNNGKFWHITDSHFEFSYDTACTDKKNDISPIGDYKCDTSPELLISSFEYMKKMEPNPDFILWTGDSPPHFENKNLNQTIVLSSISNMTNLITEYFPNTRVFPCLGNHDSYPQHQIGIGPNWLFNATAQMWSQFLSEDALETFLIGGYYTELVEPGFRIVSLNTNLYYTQDKQCINMTDPAGQLEWLNSTLASAALAGEKVWVMGHVPPGYNEKYDVFNFHKQFNDEYLFSFGEYADIIPFHIYGHEHTDSIRLYYSDIDRLGGVPDGIMFLSPSITPWMNKYLPTLPNNPGLRMYQYNTTDFTLEDYYQFWTNLTADIESNTITWELEYQATQFFKVKALDAISMFEAFLLIQSVPEQLQQYYFYNSVSYPTKGCDAVCKKLQLCTISCPFSKGFAKCLIEI